MAFNPLDYLKDLVPQNTNMFGASPNANLKQMAEMGLLGDMDYTDMLKKANKQSIFQGLLNTGLSYAAQPKNQGYGSALPYLAKAGLAGVQAAQTPYDQLSTNAMQTQKLQEMKRTIGERNLTKDSVAKFVLENPEYKSIEGLPVANQASIMQDFYKPGTSKRLANPQRLADLMTISNDPNQQITQEQQAELDALKFVVGTTSPQGISGQDLLSSPYGSPPDGYTWDRTAEGKLIVDPETNQPTATPIAGTKVAVDRIADADKKKVGSTGKATIATTVVVDAQRALDLITNNPSNTTGKIGWGLQKVPDTDAYALQQTLESLQANVGIDKLLDIKASGAGLGQVPQSQLKMLASVLGQLDIGQPRETLEYNIQRVLKLYAEIVRDSGGQEAFDAAMAQSTQTPERDKLVQENQSALDYWNDPKTDRNSMTSVEIEKILKAKGLI